MYNLPDSLDALRDSVALNSSLLYEIRQNTLDTVNNTAHTWYDEQWCLYGICVLIISIFTLIPLWTEFKKDRIDKKCQNALFVDILRHLYRNKVCVIAMKVKFDRLCRNSKTLRYPSDEHYLKLKLLPDDIHVEQFYRDHTKFSTMHEIALLLRNYNTEIEVALKHISDPHVLLPSIERDFITLNLKPGLISEMICRQLGNLGFIEKDNDPTWGIIQAAQDKNRKSNPDASLWGNEYDTEIKEIVNKEKIAEGGYNELLPRQIQGEFYENLYRDVLIECGSNSKGSPKIGIVATDIER